MRRNYHANPDGSLPPGAVAVMESTSLHAASGHAPEIAGCFAILMIPTLCGLLGYEMSNHFRMPDDPASYLAACVISLLIISGSTGLLHWLLLRRMRQQITTLQQEAAMAQRAHVAMTARADAHRQLRHDLRGALSPALLTADRLLTNSDPAVKRAGEIMVHAVERAAALMADPPPESGISPPGRL